MSHTCPPDSPCGPCYKELYQGEQRVVVAREAEIARLNAHNLTIGKEYRRIINAWRESEDNPTAQHALLLATQESAAKMRAALEGVKECCFNEGRCNDHMKARTALSSTPTVERGLAIQKVLEAAEIHRKDCGYSACVVCCALTQEDPR